MKDRARTMLTKRPDLAVLIFACLLLSLASISNFIFSAEADESSAVVPDVLHANDVSQEEENERPLVYPWARQFIRPLSIKPIRNETSVYWHIPKSGGTSTKSLFECLGLTLASRVGGVARFGHADDSELQVFKPWSTRGNDSISKQNAKYINIDVSTSDGIMKGREMGLVPSGLVDVVFTTYPSQIVENLFDLNHKGRLLAMFRHPVQRLVSKFFYLRVAKWENNYEPSWNDISIETWARKIDRDRNFLVRTLAGKTVKEVNEADLQVAKRTIAQRFIVGLSEEYDESLRRFGIMLNFKAKTTAQDRKRCYDKYLGAHGEKMNSNSHPKITETKQAFKIIAKHNFFDMQLYDVSVLDYACLSCALLRYPSSPLTHIIETIQYILKLFDEQKQVIDSYQQ
mmetsp:Transcript_23120/g.53090  ORF Transcript_23120/g.53090 Transcript_23120/m.53090 type:complete len:400 (+) Transcript_23120:74-1273(+)